MKLTALDPPPFLSDEENKALITYQSVITACHTYVASGQEGTGQTVT